MYLHIGADAVVRLRDVVAILNLQSSRTAAATRELLAYLKGQGKLRDVSDGDAKSVLICSDVAYVSAISSVTLQRRAIINVSANR